MTATLHLFARFRERAGSPNIAVPADCTVAELRTHLKALWPELANLLDASRFAADGEFVGDDCRIAEGGELAIIPPVSGG